MRKAVAIIVGCAAFLLSMPAMTIIGGVLGAVTAIAIGVGVALAIIGTGE